MIQLWLHHHHIKHMAHHDNLRNLYWSYAITGLGTAIVSVLGPIYLYKIGYSLRWIMLFLLVTAVVKLVALPLVFKLIARFGSYRMMAVGLILLILSYLSIGTIEIFQLSFVILGVIKGLANAFYYPAFRVSFAHDCDKSKAGQQVTQLHSIIMGLGVLAPLVGGFIASFWGVWATYYVGAVLFASAFGVLLLAEHKAHVGNFSIRRIPFGAATKDYISNGFYSTSGLADLLVWPILLSVIITSYAGIGAVGTLFVLMSIGVAILVGKIEDRKGERAFTIVGSVLSSLHSFARVVVSSASHLVGLGLIGALSSALLTSSYESRYYKNVDSKFSLEYLFAMEVTNALPWIIYFPVLIGLSYVLNTYALLYAGVLIVAPAALGAMLIRSNK